MSGNGYEHPVTTCLDATMVAWLAEHARRRDIGLSAMLRSLVRAAMEGEPAEKPRHRLHTRERA